MINTEAEIEQEIEALEGHLHENEPEQEEGFAFAVVPPEGVQNVWLMVYDHLTPAIERSRGRWDMKSLCEDLLTGRQHLWITFDKSTKKILGATTTQFIKYPTRLMLGIQYLGGENLDEWGDLVLETLMRWAKDNKCEGIEATGRAGLWKWFKDHDYEKAYTVYEKRID